MKCIQSCFILRFPPRTSSTFFHGNNFKMLFISYCSLFYALFVVVTVSARPGDPGSRRSLGQTRDSRSLEGLTPAQQYARTLTLRKPTRRGTIFIRVFECCRVMSMNISFTSYRSTPSRIPGATFIFYPSFESGCRRR